MFLYSLGAVAVSLGLWGLFADADLNTLFAHLFFRRRWEKYRGRVVWITGASSGIGEQLAYLFARLDCKLVISGTRLEELKKVRNRCETISQRCDVLIVEGNIADSQKHAEWLQTVLERFGTVDILVNNAGRSQRCEFTKIPREIEMELFDINVFGMISLTREVLKYWTAHGKQDNAILVTSSMAGKTGAPLSASYTASKHALHGFFESLRSELLVWRKTDVQITLACPGPVRSNIRVNAFTEKVGDRYNLLDKDDSKLLDTARCARLMLSGLACGLDELWITKQPLLLLMYAAQYMPSVYRRWILPWVMTEKNIKMRDGK